MDKKKGVSPIVATIILIAIVIILAVIIFLWARGFVAERAQKFGRAVELSCEDVDMEADVVKIGEIYFLDVVNRGNVPLYGFEIKDLSDPGSVALDSEILGDTITVGESASIELDDSSLGPGDEILIVPIILGETNSGKVAFVCPDQFGFATFV